MKLIKYYLPRLKKQLIFYPLISVLLYFLVFFTCRSMGAIFSFVIALYAIEIMVSFGPLIFASRKGMAIDTALPVSWKSKVAFILTYTFVVIPLLIDLPVAVCYFTTWHKAVINPAFLEIYPVIKGLFLRAFTVTQVFNMLFPMAVCLYCVMSIKRNRILMSIVWTIVTNLVLGVLGGIVGAVIGFKHGIEDGFAGAEYDPNPEQVGFELIEQSLEYSNILSVVLAICTIFVIIKTCRVIKNLQI